MSGFVEAIKKSSLEAVNSSNPISIIFGTVESVSPLSIRIEQSSAPLRMRELILTDAVRDFKTQITFDDPTIKQVFTTWNMEELTESSKSKISFKDKTKHKVTIYNALSVGEGVILLQVQGGQKFIVLDRTEGRK